MKLFFLLPSLVLAAPAFFPSNTFSYSVEQPAAGLSFGQAQAQEGGELVGGYRVALPGRQPRQLHQPYGHKARLQSAAGGQYYYDISYRL